MEEQPISGTSRCCAEDTTWITTIIMTSAMAWGTRNEIPIPGGWVNECPAKMVQYSTSVQRRKTLQRLSLRGELPSEVPKKQTRVRRRQRARQRAHCSILIQSAGR